MGIFSKPFSKLRVVGVHKLASTTSFYIELLPRRRLFGEERSRSLVRDYTEMRKSWQETKK